MRLVTLEVTDFRGFATGRLDLEEAGLLLLVGPNNAGKTALLSALGRLASIGKGAPVDVRIGATEARLAATFLLTADERMGIFNAFAVDDPTANEWAASPAFRRARWTFSTQGGPLRLSLLEAQTASGAFADIIKDEDPESSCLLADLEQILHVSPGEMAFHEFGRREYQPAHRFLDTQQNAWTTAFRAPFEAWRASLYHFSSSRTGTERQRPVANAAQELNPSGENLAEVLLWLHTNREATDFAAVREIIAALIPDVGLLATPTSGSYVGIAFDDQWGGHRNLKDLGSGVEQLLLLVCICATQPRATLVLLEEPERELHPDAQRLLLRLLQGWSSDRQIVISTHSPTFLDRTCSFRGGTWLVRRSGGTSTVEPLAEDLAPALEAIGARLSDVLAAERVVVVEGDSDRDVLEHWYSDRLRASGGVIAVAHGGDGAWGMAGLERLLRATSTLHQKMLFLRDRDELDGETIRKLEATGTVHVLGVRELENLLLDSEAIAQVIAEDLETAGLAASGWDANRVSDELAQAAEKLVPLTVLNRVASRIGAIRGLPRDDLTRLRSAPSLEALVERVSANLTATACINGWWQEEQDAIRAMSPAESLRIVPGEELLDAVWRVCGSGRRYSKKRDAIRIARKMSRPPGDPEMVMGPFLGT